MTKIYIYCLFEKDEVLHGVYSSIKAAHRDAIKLCNKGGSAVYLQQGDGVITPTITALRNIFKGALDIKIKYYSDKSHATILKTKLRE
ncbi:hypothetical protein CMI37_33910 [Candidatus Pacearchaeota archaeon]|nr:hypothetical protein [Candidatus Pacearchaeota archaeon]